MSDKPHPARAGLPAGSQAGLRTERSGLPAPTSGAGQALRDYAVVALGGRDALAFAQAQTMNDVAALADGHWHWNGWLTPKGRVIALFALLRLDAETVWLLLPDADPRDIASRLQRFVFRSKVAIAVREDLHASGTFAPPRAAAGAAMGGHPDNGIELDFGGEGGARTLRIGRDAAPEDAAALDRWRAFDLEHGLPRLGPSQSGHWTPQQLSLERLHAYSVRKGCYPGQEIVARTHFLGRAKRGLALLRIDAPVAPGDELRRAGMAIGSIVSTAAGDAGEALALAVLPSTREPGDLHVGSNPAHELPLRDGLAR